MKLSIQKKSPLSIREQIKRQIRLRIENGVLNPGDALPSARDLSAVLKINRNTVTQAYKELSQEGFLTIIVGSGTCVNKDLIVKHRKELDRLFDEVFEKANRLGFDTDEISEHFLNRLSIAPMACPKKSILVVDCNDEVISYLCNKIRNEIGVHAQGVLIQELESDPAGVEAFFSGKDLVVCGFNHIKELSIVAPDPGVEVVAVLLQMDARIIHMISKLPEGTRVGYVCANQRSTETFFNSAYFSGGKELKRILAGYDNSEKLKEVVRDCDMIFATNFVFDRMKELVGPDQNLVSITLSVDSTSMDLIRETLRR